MSNTPMRVLQVLRTLECGGAETLVMNLYRHVDRQQIQFDFLLFSEKEGFYDAEVLQLGGVIHRLPYVSDVGLVAWLRAMRVFFLQHPEYRIVHSHINTVSGPILWAARRAGVPVRIAHSHIADPHYPFPDRIVKAIFKVGVVGSATNLMGCSPDAARWLFGRAGQRRGVTVLKNGVDLDRFGCASDEALCSELGFEDKHVIGNVGGFRTQKNQSFLVDLMPAVLERQPNVVLVLVGDGPMRAEIERKVGEMGLPEQVRFLGVRSDIPALMSLFDVFAFPSLWEGLGIVLIEAQATGLRCVVSDTVPTEGDMGLGLVDFVSLEDQAAWVARLAESTERRADTHAKIADEGYDIAETACWLEGWYASHA